MKKNILFISDQLFDERNFKRFSIDEFRNSGFLVYVLDITPIIYPDIYNEDLAFHFDGYFRFHEIDSFFNFITNLNHFKYYFDITSDSKISYLIRGVLYSLNFTRIVYKLGLIPHSTNDNKYFKNSLLNLFNKKTFLNISYLKGIFYKIKYKYINNKTIFIVSGDLAVESFKKFRLIKAHSFDYDEYLKLVNSKKDKLEEGYILFIDEDVPYHTDYIVHNIIPPVTPELYYTSLNNFLNYLSILKGVDVKITMHPRSKIDLNNKRKFNNFPLYYDNTAQLIQNAGIVVCHSSTAIQLAVLFNKPILQITTNEIENSFQKKNILAFSNELKTKIINIDTFENHDILNDIKINKCAYDNYIKKYVKNSTNTNLFIYQIIIEKLFK